MYFYKRCGIILFCTLAGSIDLSAEDKKPETARVAVIKYEDKTGTKNFGYMPGSLQEAITKSMHTKFEFVEIDPETVEPVVTELRGKNKGIISPKTAAEICRRTNTDILIYGSFVFNAEDKEIEIQTLISLGSTDKFRTLKPVENRVDATIFQAADKVAADIVAEITKVALEQQQARGEAEKKDKKGKTQLAKTEKDKTWADINWVIQLSAGAMKPLLNGDNAKIKVKEAFNLEVYRRLQRGFHLGFLGSVSAIQSSSNYNATEVNMQLFSGAVMAGYFLDLSPRWRLTAALGAGYYFGQYESYQNCQSNCSGSGNYSSNNSYAIKNPMMTGRIGVNFLLISFLSLGAYGEWRTYYDKGGSVHSVGGGIAIGAVF